MFDIAAIYSSNMRYKVGENNIDKQISWTKICFLDNVICCL